MVVKLYNCFHDHGSYPPKKYISDLRPALLCGADLQFRYTEDITGCLRDNDGENISDENLQYSELTGYYWAWKNSPADILGIEHYRRHFIKHQEVIDNCVQPSDLLTENLIIDILTKDDFILPVPERLANTSVYDLYKICFGEQADDIVATMRDYYISTGEDNFLNALYEYMSENVLYRANMLITTKPKFDDYCDNMFRMISYLKINMPNYKPQSRVWGYVSELFPKIYVTAKGLSFKEVDMAVDDFDQDLQQDRVYTTVHKDPVLFEKDPKIQIEYFKNLKIQNEV